MRIAFIGQKGIPVRFGGIEQHVDRISAGLAARGHEVRVYVRAWYTPKAVRAHRGVRLIHIPTLHTKHLDAAVHALLCTLHCFFTKTDIVHYHGIGPSFFCFLPRIFGMKVVATVHRLDWGTEKWNPVAKFFLRFGERIAVHTAQTTIAVSADLGLYIEETYRRTVAVIPNGGEEAHRRPPRIIRQKYALDQGRYILFMGRLVPEKRPDWLINIYLRYVRKFPEQAGLKLVIAGGSSGTDTYVRALKFLAGGHSGILFTGYVQGEEKFELLSNARLFVLPSYLEGYPIALLEAMSYGLGCLVSDIAPHRETVWEGRNGWMFKTGDFSDFFEKFRFLLERPDLVEAVGARSMKAHQDMPSWDDVVRRTEGIYRTLIGADRTV